MERTVYQLRVALLGIRPPVWRQFQVPGNVHLHRLHMMLQAVMGWSNYHLYLFQVGDIEYGEPDPELDCVDSHRARLNKVVPREEMRFIYDYDFGDGWQHEIMVEKILPAEPGADYPVCLAGKRACPPEDCGGIGGYADLLRIIRNPKHKEHEEMMYWLGGSFDPENFDLDRVNRALKRFRPRSRVLPTPIPAAFRRAFSEDGQR